MPSMLLRSQWIVMGLLYCLSIAPMLLQTPRTFIIPDERAMHTLAQRIAKGQSPAMDEPLNTLAQGLIHPRSMTSIGTQIVPEGFVFVALLYGWIDRLFQTSNIGQLLTPLSTVFAAFFLERIIRKQSLSSWISKGSAIAYLLFPSILYYSFHPYLSNLLQWNILLVIVGLLSSVTPNGAWSQRGLSFLVGILFGVALALRPIEIFWIVIAVACFQARFKSMVRHWSIAWAFVGATLPLVGLAFFQQQLYGHWWAVGYASNPQFVSSEHRNTILAMVDLLKHSIFPFGISFSQSLKNFWDYQIWLYWWIAPLFLLGFIGERQKTFAKPWIKQLILPALWLVVFYGSWSIQEQTDASVHTISTSFVRYWIPLTILIIPLVLSGIHFILQYLPRWIHAPLLSIMALGLVLSTTVFTPASISAQRERSQRDRERLANVIAATPPESILLVKYSDKVYFPSRRVIVWNREPDKVRSILPEIIKKVPIFLNVVEDEGEQFTLPTTVTEGPSISIANNERIVPLALTP